MLEMLLRRAAMGKRKKRIDIRPLSRTDIPRMVEVWRVAGLPFKPRGRDRLDNLARQWKGNPDLFLGAFEGGTLVGVLLASDDGRRGWINRLAVLPGNRRNGIATALIREAERILRNRGRRLFCVNIEEGNESSIDLFVRAGYIRENEIHYYTKRELKSY